MMTPSLQRLIRAAALAVLYLLISPQAGRAQAIDLLAASDEAVDVEPDTWLTKVFYVSNRGSADTRYTARLETPPGWRIVALDSDLTIPLKSGVSVFATVYVPPEAAAGVHTLSISIENAASATREAALGFDVTVMERPGLVLEHISAPEYVVAGEVYQSMFLLRNTGNTRIEAAVDVNVNPNYEYIAEGNRITLEPGASKMYGVSVRTDIGISERVQHAVRLRVRTPGLPDAGVTSTTAVLPRISGTEEKYLLFPVRIAARQELRHADSNTFALLLQADAQGKLRPGSDAELKIHSLVPLDSKAGMLNETPELSVEYEAEPFHLKLGNGFYSVSPLTQASIFGTGGQVSVRYPGTELGAYRISTAPHGIDQTGLWYQTEIGTTAKARINVVDTTDYTTPGSIELLHGIQLQNAPLGGPLLELEAATSAFHGGGEAVHLVLGDRRDAFTYNLEMMLASPRFEGEIKDVMRYGFQGSAALRDSLLASVDLSAGYTGLNLSVQDHSVSGDYGLRWKVSDDAETVLAYQSVQTGHSDTESIRAKLKVQRGNLVTEGSLMHSSIREEQSPLHKEQYQGSVLYRPADGETIRGYGGLSHSRGLESGTGSEFGIEYYRRLTEGSRLQIDYKSTQYDRSYYSGRDSLRVSYSLDLSNFGNLSVIGSYSPDRVLDRNTDFNVSVEYHVQTGIPIGLRDEGRIIGLIEDSETGTAVPDVVVRIGDRVAVTDLSGRFTFLSMPVGLHFAEVDTSRLQDAWIVSGPMPVPITVTKRGTAEPDIQVVKPGSIQGVVTLYTRDYLGNTKSAGAAAELMLTFKQDHRIKRVITDRRGRFLLQNLHPGTWIFDRDAVQLHEGLFVQADRVAIDLVAETTESMSIGIYPVKREIQMMDEGTVIESVEDQPVESE